MQTERRDGVADFKRWRQDFQSDGVMDLVTASGRSRLKVALQDSTWRGHDLESDDESVDTPLVSPFLDSDDDSDDGEVLNELEEYDNIRKLCRQRAINSFDGDDLAFQWSFTYITDFVVLEDIGEFFLRVMAEVVMGKPFRKVTKLEYDCAEGLIGGGLILYQAYGNLYAMTGRKAYLLEDKEIPSVGVFDESRDGVADFKRRRQDFQSDGVMDLVVQELNELQEISTYIDSRLENIDQFLNGFTQQPNEIDEDNLEPDDESVDTPLVSPFLDSDDDSDDGKVLSELEGYGDVGQVIFDKKKLGSS
ncbi:hypothetical protein Tco_1313967 [Tanacetum coccineum]